MTNQHFITFLFAPDVPESNDGWLAGDTRQATVVIQPWTGMSAGERLDLYWTGDKSGEYHDYVPVTQAAIDRTLNFYIPASEIAPNTQVTVKYTVTYISGEQEASQERVLQIGEPALLPAPTLDGILGTTLFPVDIMEGATVRIAAEAELQYGDVVTLYWTGPDAAGSTVLKHTVTSAEAGDALTFTVSASVALANKGKTVTLHYEVLRGGITLQSDASTFLISAENGGKTLRVMGGRGTTGSVRNYDSRGRRLVALAVTTLKPVEATWQYAGEMEIVIGSAFYDTSPWKRLHIRTATDSVALNPVNICGAELACAALRNTGDVVAWGNANRGGSVPVTVQTFTDIAGLFGTGNAFAATRKNGSVVAWGDSENGGIVPYNIAGLKDVKRIVGSYESLTTNYFPSAFVAIRENGSLVAWGNSEVGGYLPEAISALTGVTDVVGTERAFLARTEEQHISAWGMATYGGTIPTQLSDRYTSQIISGSTGFAVLTPERHLLSWQSWGITTNTYIEAPNIGWACFNAGNNLIAWSESENRLLAWKAQAETNESIPDNIATLDDIVAVTGASGKAFLALRENGTVVSWGNTYATVPDEVAALRDIVSITSNYMAFAVLRANGEVFAWGNEQFGGNITETRASLTNVRAIYYGGRSAFTALTGDGRVVTWGNADAGGDSSAVASKLKGQVTYEVQVSV